MAVLTTSAPQDGVPLTAVDLRQLFGAMVYTGGVRLAGDLLVSQRAAGANMSVDIAAGSCAIADGAASGGGFYAYTQPAVANLLISPPHATLPRIDRVVIRVRDVYTGDPVNSIAPYLVAGTPTGGATLANCTGAAAVPANSLLIANVLVGAAVTSIANASIDTSGTANTTPTPRLQVQLAAPNPSRLMTTRSGSAEANTANVVNQALLSPVDVYTPFVVTSITGGVPSGAATSGNWDIGIYDGNFNRVWSLGTQAFPAVGNWLRLISAGSPSTLLLTPGTYYFAFVSDSVVSNNNVLACTSPTVLVCGLCYTVAGAGPPLPAVLTSVVASTNVSGATVILA